MLNLTAMKIWGLSIIGFLSLFVLALASGQSAAQGKQAVTDKKTATVKPTPIELTVENLASWREHILPGAVDLAWTKIPWLTTFGDGIVAANQADKPLLLWVMNGHPLGCT